MSNTKEKLKLLVLRYAAAIKSGNIDEPKFQARFPEGPYQEVSSIPQSELTKTALQLASDAFKGPDHKYYFKVAPEDVPVHRYHYDTLQLGKLKTLVDAGDVSLLNAYLRAGLARVEGLENLLVSFTDPVPQTFEVREDLDDLAEVFAAMGKLNAVEFGDLLLKALNPSEVSSKDVRIQQNNISSSVLFTRVLAFLILSSPALSFTQTLEIIEYCSLQLEDGTQRKDLVQVMCRMGAPALEKVIAHLQESLSLQLLGASNDKIKDSDLTSIAEVLSVLNELNYLPAHPRGLVEYTKFYNSTCLDFDMDHMKEDFYRRMENKDRVEKDRRLQLAGQTPKEWKKRFCFSDYPFLMDANFKSTIMQFDSIVGHRQAMRDAMVGARVGSVEQPFLILNIQRDNLIESTLRELNRKAADLRKPLHVKFVGEEGIDEGGPRKEFFQLICKELFDPNYGMFTSDSTQGFYWIQPTIKCNTCNIQFYLIGQVLGLAVFNSVILDVAFPQVLFRKLLGHAVDFEDLKELDPSFAQGLEDMLSFEDTEDLSVKDVFMRSFTYEHDIYGENIEVPIVPDGANVELTGANRQDFVNAMTNYVLSGSIQENFREFRNGFLSVCKADLVTSMQPKELELLVCGCPQLDFKDLEKHTRYDGYEAGDRTIKLFWEVVHEFTMDQQRTFLKFCTGSDRVPIRGLKDLGFIIGKNGEEDSGLLPTSHTCFNHLLLPVYTDKDELRKKLLLAIENCTGFGLK